MISVYPRIWLWPETYLKSVANAEDRYSELEDGRINMRRILIVYRVWGTRKDDTWMYKLMGEHRDI
jgi:hypothetical protein